MSTSHRGGNTAKMSWFLYPHRAAKESKGSLHTDAPSLPRLRGVSSHRGSLASDGTDKTQNRINHRLFASV